MDSVQHESFTISSKETFLAKDQRPSPPKATRNEKLKTVLLALLLLLLVTVASMLILHSIDKKKLQHVRVDSYEWGSGRYYCHLTVYRKLCYDSMSSIINTTELKNGPSLIFSTSLKVATSQLENVTVSISKRIRTSSSNASAVAGPRMSDCRTWVQDSLSRLNESLSMLSLLSDFESLNYGDIGNLKSAAGDAHQCLVALDEIVDGDEKITWLEEVKSGVEKARKYIVNSIGLLDNRETILNDFNYPYIRADYYDDGYYSYPYHYFDYTFIVGLYSAVYLFLALLYFLFWKSS